MEERIEHQLDLFASVMDTYKITKPIRLIELFAGIGAQFKALKMLTSKVESYKICEWAYNSILGYNAIHIKDFQDYSQNKTKEEMIERIKGISINYNEPLTEEQINRKGLEWIKSAYNNVIATHNLINVMSVKGKDLEVRERESYTYLLTYSFPCQDLSLAGLRKGMSESQANGGTRSGLLWEVERILDELNVRNELPHILLMENVKEVVGTGAIEDFKKWRYKLETLGYSNHVHILNSKDYGIPQNRVRCFMVSILGEFIHECPIKVPLKYRLKDFLDKEVDEKYYLNKAKIDQIANWKAQQDPLRDIDKQKTISPCLTARGAGEEHSGMVLINEDVYKQIPIKENNNDGYKMASIGDGVNLSGRMEYQRGNVQKGMCQTIKTKGTDSGVGDDNPTHENYSQESIKRIVKNVVDGDIVPTITANAMQSVNHQNCSLIEEETTKTYKNYITWRNKKGQFNTECNRASPENGLALTIPTKDQTKVAVAGGSTLKIRKLTPCECMKLMGFEEEDYRAMKKVGLSDSAIYHCAGDSIVTTCIVALMGEMLNKDYRKIIDDHVESIVNVSDIQATKGGLKVKI